MFLLNPLELVVSANPFETTRNKAEDVRNVHWIDRDIVFVFHLLNQVDMDLQWCLSTIGECYA